MKRRGLLFETLIDSESGKMMMTEKEKTNREREKINEIEREREKGYPAMGHFFLH